MEKCVVIRLLGTYLLTEDEVFKDDSLLNAIADNEATVIRYVSGDYGLLQYNSRSDLFQWEVIE